MLRKVSLDLVLLLWEQELIRTMNIYSSNGFNLETKKKSEYSTLQYMLHCSILYCTYAYRFLKWFKKSLKGVERHLIQKSRPSQLTFVGEELQSGEFYAKMVSVLKGNGGD